VSAPRLSPWGGARAAFEAEGATRPGAAGPDDGDGRGAVAEAYAALVAAAEARRPGSESLAYVAYEIARFVGGRDARDRRVALAIVLAVLLAETRGHTRLSLGRGVAGERDGALGAELAALGLAKEAIDAAHGWLEAALTPDHPGHAIVGGEGSAKPLVVSEGALYAGRLFRRETQLDAALLALFTATPSAHDEARAASAMADVSRRPIVPLSGEQRAAVLRAAIDRLAVVSGGPGTGKTSIVVSLLRVLVRIGVGVDRIALAAPTGKAAFRMQDSVGRSLARITDPAPEDERLRAHPPAAETLHRLLGYSPTLERFRHGPESPLPYDVVIVDEASMIDLVMMDRLVSALAADARLVLLGDADQLPSVEAGAVLRDLVSLPGVAVRLEQSYRMNPADPHGRAILLAARSVQRGDASALLDADQEPASGGGLAIRREASALALEGAEWIDGAYRAHEAPLLDRWARERLLVPEILDVATATVDVRDGRVSAESAERVTRAMARHESQRILTLTRGFRGSVFAVEARAAERPESAAAVNAALHARVADGFRRHMHGARDVRAFGDGRYLPGEPLLVERNDYRHGLFNGDQGIVVSGRLPSGRTDLFAVFPRDGALVAYPLAALAADITLAYATTVHKAQGSECDVVLLVLPDEDMPILTREIVYTALTRSRRGAAIVGRAELLRKAVERPLVRESGLADKLAKGLETR
jgi:exodeoxyribonuclease V alpha subunit